MNGLGLVVQKILWWSRLWKIFASVIPCSDIPSFQTRKLLSPSRRLLSPTGMTRAFFYRWLCLFLFAVHLAAVAAEQKSQQRPNIIFCFADDWAWPHEALYGDKVLKLPNFERVAKEGALFKNAFSAAPSCTPSRAAILTGRAVHSLEDGANLHGLLPKKFNVYPNILEKSGYSVGFSGKGWGPGNFQAGGRERNPAGPQFQNFANFLKTVPDGKPFCFWYGSHDPHRPYEAGSGKRAGMKTDKVKVPAYWPDNETVRSDILDYYAEVERFDRDVGTILTLLAEKKLTENTMVVISGDNGLPFPRCKANLYNWGSHQPLAIRWPAKFKGGKTFDEFVNLYDLTPTFLDAAGLERKKDMTGESLLPLLEGKKQAGRDRVFIERERHANCRKGDLSYPSRAVRTGDFLYIKNFRPDRWPAGDPQKWKAVGEFGDCDASPTKQFILDHRNEPEFAKYFTLCFDKRPAEELYDLKKDPFEVNNVAGEAKYAATKEKLRSELTRWMRETGDPRATVDDDRFDTFPYFGKEQ